MRSLTRWFVFVLAGLAILVLSSSVTAADEAQAAPGPVHHKANVRIDAAITSRKGSDPPVVKTVSLVVVDGRKGSLRSATVPEAPGFPGSGEPRPLSLNLDASPEVDGDRVVLFLSLNHGILEAGPAGGGGPTRTEATSSLMAVLESGKPLVVVRSADPLSDHVFTVEVTATILR